MARTDRDIFSVAKDGVEDKWWHLEVTEYEDGGFFLSLESPATEVWDARGWNAWDAMRTLRAMVEPLGYRLCCNGARRDAYVSRMLISMADGELVYLLHRWRSPRRRDLVGIFSYAPPEKIGTIADQDRYFERWSRQWWARIL
jgi:hypothetical protein